MKKEVNREKGGENREQRKEKREKRTEYPCEYSVRK